MHFKHVFLLFVPIFSASSFVLYYYVLRGRVEVKYLRNILAQMFTRKRFAVNNVPNGANGDTKYVLFWTNSSGYKLSGFELFETCEFSNCYATGDRTLLPVEKFDSLLFDGRRVHGPPERRDTKQRYVFANTEPPVYRRPLESGHRDNFFNWTMTYRSDSDIYRPFGRVSKRRAAGYKTPSPKALGKKSRLIAWNPKGCETRSRRESYVKELRKFVDVDVGCEFEPITGNKTSVVLGYDTLEKYYKFYLSFEDSLCSEYVTEELYDVLKLDVVPIVYGGADYGSCAPPFSVINIARFRSPANLAMYLLHLDANVEEYLKYFRWKREFVVETGDEVSACILCKKLHDLNESAKFYSNLDEWWWGKNNEMCQT